MTPEARFDRLERIVKLMIKAGVRARRQMREQDEKINIIIDAQIKNEERFAKNEERFAENDKRFGEGFVKLAEAQTRLADSQTHADQRLDELIKVIRDRQNGRSST